MISWEIRKMNTNFKEWLWQRNMKIYLPRNWSSESKPIRNNKWIKWMPNYNSRLSNRDSNLWNLAIESSSKMHRLVNINREWNLKLPRQRMLALENEARDALRRRPAHQKAPHQEWRPTTNLTKAQGKFCRKQSAKYAKKPCSKYRLTNRSEISWTSPPSSLAAIEPRLSTSPTV